MNSIHKKNRNWKRFAALLLIGAIMAAALPVFAAPTDVIQPITNFRDILFSLLRAVGVIAIILSIVQFSLALHSHDASQRSTALLVFVAGLIFAFIKEIILALGITL